MRYLALIALLGCLPLSAQQNVTGPVTIYDTTYERVDAGPPFTEAPRQEENWQPPAPLPAERKAGFIPFTRLEPFDIKPWSIPRDSERIRELRCSVARGETTALWFAVHAMEPLRGVHIDEHARRAEAANAPQPAVEIRYAHFWAQRTDWRGRTYYVTPELLLPMRDGKAQFPARGGTLEWRPLDVPQGECRLFWIKVRTLPDCRPGTYTSTLVIQSENREALRIPLQIRVYPFRLNKPIDKRWLLYSDSHLLGNMSDDKLQALLREVAEHGIDGLTELPIGEIDLSDLKQGRVRYNPASLLRWHRLMRQAGLRGPHTIGTFIEDQVPGRLGIEADVNREWTPPVREAMRQIARTVIQKLQPYRIPWMFYGWDEPGPETIRALEQYRTWREAGADTYVTFYQRGTYDAAAQWLTHPCFSVGLVASRQTARWAEEQCRARGQKFFWYGSGCYLGQEGRMFPNRYLAGWLFWKTKADGQVSWTFVRPHEDPFNDFDGAAVNSVEPKDQCTVYPELASPNDYKSIQRIIPTIQWEALREGINDYRYLATLRNIIAYARQVAPHPKGNQWARELLQTADECERTLKAVEESVPWLNEVGRAGCTNASLQETRMIVGRCIEKLVLLLKGERVAPPKPVQSVTLHVHIVPPVSYPVSPTYLPVLQLPRWKQPPAIDGKMNEPVWDNAAVASSFYESQTSVPMPENLKTQAMLAFDGSALYIGFRCRAPHPERLVADQTRRDAEGIWLDEGVEIFLASPDAPERYAHFIINARGVVYDELGFNAGWNTEVQVATHTDSEGWTAEVAIPWRSLPFAVNLNQTGKPLLRLNLGRNHKERGEAGVSHWAWSPTFGWFHNPQRFGIAALHQGDILVREVIPPAYVNDSPVQITLANLGEREQQVEADGQRVTLPPKGSRHLTIPSSTAPGEHLYLIHLRWQNGQLELPVAYSIPHPIQVVKRVAVAAGAEAFLTIALALRQTEEREVQVRVWDAHGWDETSFPAGRDFTLRLHHIKRDRLSVEFALGDSSSRWMDSAVLYVLPAPVEGKKFTPRKTGKTQ
ncbi:MAG: sugar-binding protein [Armatimonadota bacterium]